MSQSSSNRLISRITALHKSLQLDEGEKVSSMERDLMLGYLRELYELYAEQGMVRAKNVTPPTAPKPSPAPAPAPPPYTPPASAPPPVFEVKQPVATPTPEPAPPKSSPAPVTSPPSPTPPPAPTINTAASGDIKKLFVGDPHANPFGRQPLKDLTKSLTINNRALFTRDLFGGDNDLLNTTLSTLNTSGSIAVAQPVLESLARSFEWTKEGKKETAREFIELVRRRYA